MAEAKRLSLGIFWVVSDSESLENYKLLYFNVPCDVCGNAAESPAIPLNSKSGTSYNHKAIWSSHVKNNTAHKPYNKRNYNYYPRGRVVVSNNKAVIYLNPVINQASVLADIKAEFGLDESNIGKVRVVADNSVHYQSGAYGWFAENGITPDEIKQLPDTLVRFLWKLYKDVEVDLREVLKPAPYQNKHNRDPFCRFDDILEKDCKDCDYFMYGECMSGMAHHG